MSGNEITIVIRTRSGVREGFADARRDAEKVGDDIGESMGRRIEEKMRKHGEGSGDTFRTGFSGRMLKFGNELLDNFGSAFGKLGGAMPGFLGDAIGKLPPQGAAIAGVLAAGLAPALGSMLGAAMSTAVLMTVGGGVLAAGIALVAKQPAVKSAFGKMKDQLFDQDTSAIEEKIKKANERLAKAQALGSKSGIKSAKYDIEKAKQELEKATSFNETNQSLRDMAQVFQGPLVRAARTFTQTVKDLKPDIRDLFGTMAPVIDKLAGGLSGLVKNMMPGIKEAAAASVPLFDTLAKHLPKIGEALTVFFDQISQGGADANNFFDDFLGFIESSIRGLGHLIKWLTKMYDNANLSIDEIGRFLSKMGDNASKSFHDISSTSSSTWSKARSNASKSLHDIDGFFDKMGSNASASLHDISSTSSSTWSRMKSNASASFHDIGSFFSRMGSNARASFRDITGAARSAWNSVSSAVSGAISRATATVRNFINKVIGWFHSISHPINITIVPKILSSAANAVTGFLHGIGFASGGIKGAASGTLGGGLTWVGEQGPELVDIPTGSRVHSNPDSMRMAQGAGQGGSWALRVVGVAPHLEYGLIGQLINALRFEIVNTHSGNVQAALGRG